MNRPIKTDETMATQRGTNDANEYLLVTGCYRSGTTVVEKVLNMHPAVTVASQPFPVLYFMVKEQFNKTLGIERRYPLDHLFLEDAYTPEQFEAFLDSHCLDEASLGVFVRRMHEYSEGLWTPAILGLLSGLMPGTFYDVYEQLLARVARLFPKAERRYLGSKEVLVEEFAAPLMRKEVRTIFVVRDPRAMIASLNFRERDNLTGNLRPVLYSLRAWRKSVALAQSAMVGSSAYLVRYEDVVRNALHALEGLVHFLGVAPYAANAFAEGLIDQDGRPWKGNSSFSDQKGISGASLDAYASRLPKTVQAFVEAVCEPEMELMGYDLTCSAAERSNALETYTDPFSSIHERFPADYSSDLARRRQEKDRLRLLQDGVEDIESQRRWFIAPEAYSALAAARS
ncbi:MAG: sulfotransferase [Deltaproteobacteria bacterium]|nr:sulfotransferase [Deltaproteobacteria bacterium]